MLEPQLSYGCEVEIRVSHFLPYVAGYIPNCVQAVTAMLAASSIGAVWSSTSPDFGVNVSVQLQI